MPVLNYVDYVEDLIGHPLVADNAATIGRMSRRQLGDVREKNLAAGWTVYEEHLSSGTPGDSEGEPAGLDAMLDVWRNAPTPYERVAGVRGEFRPILHGRIHRAARVFGGDRGLAFREGDPEARLAALKRYLLYAHRIVLPDPLFYVNQYFVSEPDLFEKSRSSLIGFLDFLHSIEALVKSGIVSFYPQYEHGRGNPVESFKDNEFSRWVRAEDVGPEEEVLLRAGQAMITELLFFCGRFEADCSFDRPEFERVLAAMTAFGHDLQAEQIRDRARKNDRAALERLGSVALPGLEHLSMKDVVAVRTKAEGFDRWRDALGEGLRQIEGEAEPEQIEGAVRDTLARGCRQVEEEVESSGFFATARRPTQSLTIGAITGMIFGGPAGALLGASASTAMTVLVEYLGGFGERKSTRALRAHYSVWG